MLTAGVVTIAYAALLLAGAVMGARSGSRVSLTSGGAAGTLALIAGVALALGRAWGAWLGLVVAATLTVVFTVRYLRTGKFFPAGVTLMLSVAVGLVLLSFARTG